MHLHIIHRARKEDTEKREKEREKERERGGIEISTAAVEVKKFEAGVGGKRKKRGKGCYLREEWRVRLLYIGCRIGGIDYFVFEFWREGRREG